MKIGIISDIHSNYEALRNVIFDLETMHIKKVFCLGDIIGYGPLPEETINLLQEKNILSTMGNHEAALFNTETFKQMNINAKESLTLTKSLLSGKSQLYLSALSSKMHFKDLLFTHGSPPDQNFSLHFFFIQI